MKHDVLRRAAALLLALVLAVPAVALPAAAETTPKVTLDRSEIVAYWWSNSPSSTTTQQVFIKETTGFPNSGGTLSYEWKNNSGTSLTVAPSKSGESVSLTPEAGGRILEATVTATWTPVEGSTASPMTAEATCRLYVYGVTMEKSVTLGQGGTADITVRVDSPYENDSSDYTAEWRVDYAGSKLTIAGDTSSSSGVYTGTVTASADAGTMDGMVSFKLKRNGADLFSVACKIYVTDSGPVNVPVTGVTLDKDKLTVEVGKNTALAATVSPANATNKSVMWRSSNEDVATVGISGLVTGVKEGTATITVTTVDGSYTDTCAVTVTKAAAPVPVTGVTVTGDVHSLAVGTGATLTATVSPADATNKAVSWSSSNEAVVYVTQGGVLTARAIGSAVITVTTEDGGFTATYAVTVTPPPVAVDSIYVSPNNMEFNRTDAKTRQISVGINPSDATFGKVEWFSSNTSVATVAPDSYSSDGILAIVTAVNPGKAIIRAEAGGKIDECEVTVSGFTLNRSSLTLLEGKSENLSLNGPFGQAVDAGPTAWQSSDSSVVVVNSGGRLTGRSIGTATITATRGSYTASCVVTVVEDTSCLIRVDKRLTAGEELKFDDKVMGSDYSQSIRDALNSISRAQTGADLSYVSNLSVPTGQGTVYCNYLSEGDTGSGVGMTEKFYYSPGVGQQSITKLSFISRNDYSGVAEISYTGYSINRQTFKGVIRIQVGAMYDAFYNTYSSVHITFRASDFNAACQGLTGRDLSYVTFTLPLESRGTLYYNYPGPTQYTEKVTAGAQYRYTSTPNLNNVSFVPAEGYTGTFSITYRGVNTAGAAFTGRLVITVNDPVISTAANLYYTAEAGKQVVLRPADFDNACRAVTGETLNYVRFTPPPSSQGSLVYDYRGVGNPGTPVTAGTSYYRSGSPAIGNVSFFSTVSSPEQVAIDYIGYGTGGSAFRGTVYITLDEVSQQTIRYSVDSGKAVAFRAEDFNTACRTATGDALNYVRFQLPATSEGLLCYQYNASKNPPYTSRVSSATSYYYAGGTGTRQIGSITFLSDANHAGTVSFTYTGYTKKGVTFTGTVVIQVSPAVPGQVSFNGTGVEPIRVYSYSFRNACNQVLDNELSYIQFSSLPSNSTGRLYLNHSGYGTGTQVSAGTKYYVVGTPGIDQISFVPRGGYQGTVTIPYTGVSVSGRQVSGQLKITVNDVTGSRYFEDMGSHRWAAASVDYLYLNGVTKGMSAREYGPSLNIRRCDFVVMLCRIFNLTAPITDADGFPDVPADAYYAREVAIAKKLGIVSGDGVNFNPKGSLTRQDAMVIIRNTLNVMGWNTGGTPTNLDGFADSAAISGYARSAVGALVQFGVIKGDTNNRLRPRDIITRAEVAMILHSVMTM